MGRRADQQKEGCIAPDFIKGSLGNIDCNAIFCVLAAHLLRRIDDTRVVSELQRSDHSCPNGQHERKRQLLLREQYESHF